MALFRVKLDLAAFNAAATYRPSCMSSQSIGGLAGPDLVDIAIRQLVAICAAGLLRCLQHRDDLAGIVHDQDRRTFQRYGMPGRCIGMILVNVDGW